MSTLKNLLQGVCMVSLLTWGGFKAVAAEGPATKGARANASDAGRMGIYTSAGDFVNNKLSYAGDCASGNCRVKLYELFGSSSVALICNGQKQVFERSKIYGYKDCKDAYYRFSGQSTYKILDTAGFYLYSLNKLVQGQKIARPETLYYFSTSPDGALRELTLANLQTAFGDNAKFRYALAAQFHSDKELIAYDGQLKTYKIKYIFSQSLQ